MNRKFLYGFLIMLTMTGCQECNDQVIQGLILIAGQPPVSVWRISGATYMDFDKQDALDSWEVHDAYLSVRHNPGCGTIGNDGTDRFFDTKKLPDNVVLLKADFAMCTNGYSCKGNFTGAGSRTAELDGDDVKWTNSCYGLCKGKDIVYHISFLVSVPFGTDVGEPLYPPDAPIGKDFWCAPPSSGTLPGIFGHSPATPAGQPNQPVACDADWHEVCASGGVPAGYVISAVNLISQKQCANCQGYTIYKLCNNLPKGTTQTVYINSPVPAGWAKVANSAACSSALEACVPCSNGGVNVMTIVRL